MNLFKWHSLYLVSEDYIHKYGIKSVNSLPQFVKLSLSIQFKENKNYGISLLEILGFQKPILTKSRSNILSLNLKKGEVVGCKLVLRQNLMYDFLQKLLFEILPSVKNFKGFKPRKQYIMWHIKDVFSYDETYNIYIYLQNARNFDLVVEIRHGQENYFQAHQLPVIIAD